MIKKVLHILVACILLVAISDQIWYRYAIGKADHEEMAAEADDDAKYEKLRESNPENKQRQSFPFPDYFAEIPAQFVKINVSGGLLRIHNSFSLLNFVSETKKYILLQQLRVHC